MHYIPCMSRRRAFRKSEKASVNSCLRIIIMLKQNRSPASLLLLVSLQLFSFLTYARTEETPLNKQLALADCIQLALENNLKLTVYRNRMSQKEEARAIARAGGLADLNVSASYNRLSHVPQMKQRFIGNSLDDYQAKAWLKQPLYAGGRINAAEDESLYALNATMRAYDETRNEVVFAVKAAYYRLLFAGEVIIVKRDLLERLQSYLSVAQELNRRTKLPREETLLRIRAQVSNARQEYISAEKGKSIARKMLILSMGIKDDAKIVIAGNDIPDDELMGEASVFDLKFNAELMRLDEEIRRAESLVGIAKSARYPLVNLQLSYGYEWAKFPPEQDDWAAGITMDMPLWDWNKTKGRIKQAQSHVDETRNLKALAESQLSYEMESAYLNYWSNIERIRMAKEGLQDAQKSLLLFEKRYRGSTATSLELLDAEQSYLQARLNYLQAVLDMRLAKAEIERITGKPYESQ